MHVRVEQFACGSSTGERELQVSSRPSLEHRVAWSDEPVTLVLMSRSRRPKPVGLCSLCKQERRLTFEHIPP